MFSTLSNMLDGAVPLWKEKQQVQDSLMTEGRLTAASASHQFILILFLMPSCLVICYKRLARMDDVTPVWDRLCICSSAVFQHDLNSLKCFRDLSVRFSSSTPENRWETPREPVQQSLMSVVIRITLTMARCSHP